MSHANFGQRRSLNNVAKLFRNTITNGKSQTLLSDFFFSENGRLYTGYSQVIHYLHNPIIHLYYPPKHLHKHYLQFLLGHENVPREVENNAYADFFFFFLGGGGGKRVVLWDLCK